MSHAQRSSILPTVSGSWWALAVRGVAAVLIGLATLAWPGPTLALLIILYGALALVDGGFAIAAGLRTTGGTRRWLLLVEGVLGLLAGLVALFWPGLAAVVALYVFSFWAVFGGLMRILGAILLRREIDNEWTMALGGVLWVLLGIALAVLPGAGLLALAWVIGLLTLAMGVTLIAQAFRVRGHRTGDGSRVV